ncbi:uncharacterized protein LOC131310781 isoform X4 [Rhododendron vialii]|uniref:uncharacterized protein LOC131310781 isoform X4 n=1 Tax=Rhododendron vialii TaxID=182163 RepID=UPI00265F63E7|nr:uncharacterized protein LOC131310781 isoform X4 [Rhododendron vialii]
MKPPCLIIVSFSALSASQNFCNSTRHPRNSKSCLVPEVVRGLRVLLVDGDSSALVYIASVLEEQLYNVKTTKFPSVALSMIQEGENEFDLVMADIGMKGMDIFTFLKRVLVRSDMPIIFMSSDEDFDLVTKALCEGACFFLHKPIRRWDIINVWQHVYRKRTFSQKIGSRKGDLGKEVPENDPRGNKITVVDSSFKNIERNDFLGTGNKTTSIDRRGKSRIEVEGGLRKVCVNQDQESPREARISSVERGNQGMPSRKRGIGTSYGGRSEERSDFKGLESVEDGSEGKDSDDDSSSLKKRSRMKWTPSLHLKFLDAVSSMGDGKVHPRTLLRRMSQPELSLCHVASHLQDMPASPYNFYGANGFTTGILDQHDPTMQTQGVFNYPHSLIGAATLHFGASSMGQNNCSSLGGHMQDPPPPGYSVPLYQKRGKPPNSDTPAHYTIKSLQKALKSASLSAKRDSLLSVNNMFSAPVHAANTGELPIHVSNGLNLTGPNGTDLIGNANEIYSHENQQLLGLDWSTQNFTHWSPVQGCLSNRTGIYQSVDVLPDVPQQVVDPFDQDLNPPTPSQYLQSLDQLAAQETGYFEGQSSNSSCGRSSSSFASNQELIPPNPGSFCDLLKLLEGGQEESNREPEIAEDDFDRYLEWFCSPDCGNDILYRCP